VQALKDVISNQQIQYDFTYYGITYETQIPVLTLSVGKSLLPVSHHLCNNEFVIILINGLFYVW